MIIFWQAAIGLSFQTAPDLSQGSAFSRVLFHTTREYPACWNLSAIAFPIKPSPMIPMHRSSVFGLVADSAVGAIELSSDMALVPATKDH
jgi:hypothetical protein